MTEEEKNRIKGNFYFLNTNDEILAEMIGYEGILYDSLMKKFSEQEPVMSDNA